MPRKVFAKKLELVFNVSPDIPPVLIGDPLRIGQILINYANMASPSASPCWACWNSSTGAGATSSITLRYLSKALDNPRYEAPQVIRDNMDAGHIGLKTRLGFLIYEGMDVGRLPRSEAAGPGRTAEGRGPDAPARLPDGLSPLCARAEKLGRVRQHWA